MFKLKEFHKTDENVFAFGIANPHECYHNDDHCLLHLAAFKYSWWFKIPVLFKPKCATRNYVNVDGVEKTWEDCVMREYGFYCNAEALHIRYGIQSGSWSRNDPENSDRSKCYFLPWNQYRRYSYKFYHPDWSYAATANDKPNGAIDFDSIENAVKDVRKETLIFNDFDGEEIRAECHIEEMIWRRGTGWFKFLGYVLSKKEKLRVEIQYSSETGRQKGSWKGGVMGESCEIQFGESIIDAFTRHGSGKTYEKGYGEVFRGFSNIRKI